MCAPGENRRPLDDKIVRCTILAGDAGTFMAGGGKIPGWVLALSIFATYVSSISFLALPAKAYLSNWNVLVLSFSIPIAAGIAAVWFVLVFAGALPGLIRRKG